MTFRYVVEYEVDSWMLVAFLRLHLSATLVHLMRKTRGQSSSHYQVFDIKVNKLDASPYRRALQGCSLGGRFSLC